MLRISEVESGNHVVTLLLEGRIVGDWVKELGPICDRLLKEGRDLRLDMAEVEFIDRPGIALLQKLREQEVLLLGCSAFLEEQFKIMVSGV